MICFLKKKKNTCLESNLCLVCSDFDEQTADDWDVDMSVYYDKGSKPVFHPEPC